MALIATRDADALALLYDRHHRAAFSLAYRIVNDVGQAEDIVQEGFLAVWQHSASYVPGRGRPRAWLLTIVRNRAINQLRRGQLAPGKLAELDEGMTDPNQPEVWRAVIDGLQADDVRAAVAELPPAQRIAIELAFFGGLTHNEVAELLAVPLGTIKSRIRLAFQKLEGFLRMHVTESSV